MRPSTTTTPTASPDSTPAVEVRGLTAVRDGRSILDDVSFTVEQGEVVALLGPDGAGKTAIVETIAGRRAPDAGSARVLGHDAVTERAAVRRLLGVQPRGSSLPRQLTAREIVATRAGQSPDPLDPDELLERLGLGASAGTRCTDLSGDAQQRVSIAVALAGRPRAVVLDEPTTGIDPAARRDILGLLEQVRDHGITVLVVTRLAAEAERLADRVGLLDRGRIVALDTPSRVVEGVGLRQRLRFTATPTLDQDWVRRLPEVVSVERHREEFVVTGDARMLFSVVSLLGAHDVVPDRLRVEQPTLHDALVALAGGALRPRSSARAVVP